MFREPKENWSSSYMTYIFGNYQSTFFSSSYLVCGNSDKNKGDKD